MAQTRYSVCALDCPDTCALLVKIDDTGRASQLSGDPKHPITRGFLCGKVARYLDREYHPQRLLHPMRCTGPKGMGEFETITWGEALDEIADKLTQIAARSGPEAVLPYSYAGTMGMLNGSGMDRRFFHRLGASRLDRTICSAAGGEALLLSQGAKLGMEPEAFRHSKLIIAWGANILGTNAHLWPFIVEARRNGAKFYVIDPVLNRTGKAADRHFSIYPGSDTALALGIMHVLVRHNLHDADYVATRAQGFDDLARLVQSYTPERVAQLTGIAATDIEQLAREWATTEPAAIRLGYGVQRNDRGGAAVRAIAALPVLTGAWRHYGGGMQLSTSGAFAFNRNALERPDLQWKSQLGRQARLVNMAHLGRALVELDQPRVEALVVYNSNPAAIAPHQQMVLEGLRREDLFTVVLEQFQTDTADWADLVLPVTTFLEHTDLYLAYGHYYVQLARPALQPPGEARSNVEIFRALAQRMGFDDPCFRDSEDDMIRAALDSESPYLRGITLERLQAERFIRLTDQQAGEPMAPFADGFPTHSGKFCFGADSLAYTPAAESRLGQDFSRQFPLELISAKADDSMNSTFGHRSDTDAKTSRLTIHPADAAQRAISDGDLLRVFNQRGECFLHARISEEVSAGVVSARSMRWNKCSPDGRGINQLTSDRLTDIGAGPTFYSCLVEVERTHRPLRT